jgi:hypothetical protein
VESDGLATGGGQHGSHGASKGRAAVSYDTQSTATANTNATANTTATANTCTEQDLSE